MSSNKPLPISSNSPDLPFLQRNAAELDSIQLFAELSDGFTIGFMEVNTDLERGLVVEYFRHREQSAIVQWVPIDLTDENLEYFGSSVKEQLKSVDLRPDKKPVLLIFGLEQSIGVTLRYPEVLVNLNMERDNYPRILPYPIILLLPGYAITRLARYAPDFWSWQSIDVCLQSNINKSGQSSTNFHDGVDEIVDFNYKKTEQPTSQSHFEFLQEMLASHLEPTVDRARLLLQLGNVYCHNYKNTEAEIAYRSALDIYDNIGISAGQSNAILKLLRIYDNQGNYLEVIKLGKRNLIIQEAIGDRDTEASTLYCLSRAYQALGKLKKALTSVEKALKIYKDIGDKRSKADALYQISSIYKDLEEWQKALTFSEQALQIDIDTGNHDCQAASLRQISGIYQELGEQQKSLIFSEQALKIYKDIGDKYGVASSFYRMSITYQSLGELQKSLILAEQSLHICIKIGDRSFIAGASQQISRVHEALGELQKATKFSEEALQIYRETGQKLKEEAVLQQLAIIQEALSAQSLTPASTQDFLASFQPTKNISQR
jgi:tetratricopeptide (TPR) repeat protein